MEQKQLTDSEKLDILFSDLSLDNYSSSFDSIFSIRSAILRNGFFFKRSEIFSNEALSFREA